MREVITSRKYDDAALVVEVRGGGIVLLEYDTSDSDFPEFAAAYEICDVDMARELIEAIRKVAKELGWSI